MRRIWTILAVVVAGAMIAAGVWTEQHVSARSPGLEREAAAAEVRQTVSAALERADLTPAQRTEVAALRQFLRDGHAVRREGKPVDEAALRQAGNRLRDLLQRAHPADRERIQDSLAKMRQAGEWEIRMRELASLDAFVDELGMPLGLVAYYAAASERVPARR